LTVNTPIKSIPKDELSKSRTGSPERPITKHISTSDFGDMMLLDMNPLQDLLRKILKKQTELEL